jgi:hypothetical protein
MCISQPGCVFSQDVCVRWTEQELVEDAKAGKGGLRKAQLSIVVSPNRWWVLDKVHVNVRERQHCLSRHVDRRRQARW